MTLDPQQRFYKLQQSAAVFENLRASTAILNWDQQMQMPPAAYERRGDHMGAVFRARHQVISDPTLSDLLDHPGSLEDEFATDSDEAALIRTIRHQHERLTQVPGEFVEEFMQQRAASREAYGRALQEQDFSIIAPQLKQTLEISRRFSAFFPQADLS